MTPRAVEIRLSRSLPSWNKFYAGVHWVERAKLQHEWHNLVVQEALMQLGAAARRKFDVPVRIAISCTFHGRRTQIDPDNLCAKLVIDGLKGLLLEDDSPTWVHSVTLGPCTRGPAPLTIIRIEEATA